MKEKWKEFLQDTILSKYSQERTMRIYICDDEQKMADNLAGRIAAQLPSADVQVFYHGSDLWQCMGENKCDLVFLDIDMPDISGLDIASKMSELPYKPLLVFVTSHDELVYDSLKFHPFGFIRKHMLNGELGEVLEDCARTIRGSMSSFSFMTVEGKRKVALHSILYFEADGNYLKLYTGQNQFRFRDTLYAVEQALQDRGFVRVHKGFLVNQAAVELLGKEELILVNQERIPIGKRYGETARTVLMRYML